MTQGPSASQSAARGVLPSHCMGRLPRNLAGSLASSSSKFELSGTWAPENASSDVAACSEIQKGITNLFAGGSQGVWEHVCASHSFP